MKCLCCGKDLTKEQDFITCWHSTCIKKFFSTSNLPDIDLTKKALESLAIDSVNKGLTIPGVQRKLSLSLSKEANPKLTYINYPTGYIIKPQTPEYDALPEAEYLVMQMAKYAGIRTVPFALIQMHTDQTLVYITKRIDRIYSSQKSIEKKAMEDFCQLENRLTIDKYHSSYERCAKVIQKYSITPGLDLAELFLRLVFSFIAGNSDMHLKNFSLIETSPGSQEYQLSDAYDMLPVNIILPEDQEELALTLNGKKRNLRKNDFLLFADYCGINKTAARKMIQDIISKENIYLDLCENSYLPRNMKDNLIELIKQRIIRLKGTE